MADYAAFFPHGQLPGPLELAFVGDSVYDLTVRAMLVKKGGHVHEMHGRAVGYVRAQAQAEALGRLESVLTEEEAGVVRRARNARQTPTKNAGAADYHRATALEALIGFLYLTGQSERLGEILQICLNEKGNG